MFIVIINDCQDANAAGRQITRAVTFLRGQATIIGVQNDLEAAGNLIDALDAAESKRGVVMANVAPRSGRAKKWPNGTPFGYFWHKDALVLASVDGLTLSLAKKFKIAQDIRVLDISTVLRFAKERRLLGQKEMARIQNSQFRSFDFLPKAVQWIEEGYDLPFESMPMSEVPDAPKSVWWVDNFGNCKTTILPEEINFEAGKFCQTKFGNLPMYSRLKDVPDGEIALVIGSSGIGEDRFVEIVAQGGNAAKELNLGSGKEIR
ncbi:MAG: hypothetical protein A2748_03260 [Candidatus Wildermuthbacteria bacterium RIFCSPHIGHO2_01_FULL_45_20]|uniref:S-adenosyl-l-methionine hydroxide adenosyltransferase C-terminal domain-containing protein n=1 Tax=Candidatus Wildermuthbacteria bacterium RIFCSPHIGHO2_02_FULL_45_25 TaxID=1802450 RepID=A0A1G2R6Q3_9BACT|nr:MAG: hypothetical protein A2748_03260 [Candidatus Wildermuthbacteria bacterium RIFCSPHIGHO2_01_FULL_45_20]OHA67932.1 MAG: hypothetical protein A3C04_04655 [Candidatus Wildermuthbacteria bacterium RIFCSPHIGHO2_02_FULL_45_25]